MKGHNKFLDCPRNQKFMQMLFTVLEVIRALLLYMEDLGVKILYITVHNYTKLI